MLTSNIGPIAVLDERGVILRVNRVWRELLERNGMPPGTDAWVGANYLETCSRNAERGAGDLGVVHGGLAQVLGGDRVSFEHQFRGFDDRWYGVLAERLDPPEGGALIAYSDLANRRVAEQRAEEGRREIAHLGRSAALGELAASLAHELRQPLAGIAMNTAACERLLSAPSIPINELRTILSQVGAAATRASNIIGHMSTLLRKDKPKPDFLNLNDLCGRILELVHASALERQTEVRLELDERLPVIEGDAVQLEQVLLNLVLNALDAAASSSGKHTVEIRTTSLADGVELSVSDSGPGLSSSVAGHLFQPYFTTKATGLGMGLRIVHLIVKQHGGQVSGENGPLGGAVFRVVLPLTPQP